MSRSVTALAILASVGCASSMPSSSDERSADSIKATGVVILANHCERLSRDSSRAAEATMSRLVEHCNVLTQPSTFRVILDPSGSIGFARAGDAGADEIPMCVVTQKLQHHVRLKAPCLIDVRFEPTSIAPR